MTVHRCDVRALTGSSPSTPAQKSAWAAVQRAADVVRQGGLVVFPTETFYGIAACPTDATALARLARLKARPADKPVALIAHSIAACEALVALPAPLRHLAETFWPGPLTLLLAPRVAVSPHILGPAAADAPGSGAVGVRVSSHPVAAALSGAAGGLITATSANLAGAPAVADCATLSAAIVAGVDVVLDGGHLVGALPSTVVRLAAGAPCIVRAGALALDALQRALAHLPADPRHALG